MSKFQASIWFNSKLNVAGVLLQDWGLRWLPNISWWRWKKTNLRLEVQRQEIVMVSQPLLQGKERHPQAWPWWCLPGITHSSGWDGEWPWGFSSRMLLAALEPGRGQQDWNNLAPLSHLHLTRNSRIFSRISPILLPWISSEFWLCWDGPEKPTCN